jgi:hypothetical protein
MTEKEIQLCKIAIVASLATLLLLGFMILNTVYSIVFTNNAFAVINDVFTVKAANNTLPMYEYSDADNFLGLVISKEDNGILGCRIVFKPRLPFTDKEGFHGAADVNANLSSDEFIPANRDSFIGMQEGAFLGNEVSVIIPSDQICKNIVGGLCLYGSRNPPKLYTYNCSLFNGRQMNYHV